MESFQNGGGEKRPQSPEISRRLYPQISETQICGLPQGLIVTAGARETRAGLMLEEQTGCQGLEWHLSNPGAIGTSLQLVREVLDLRGNSCTFIETLEVGQEGPVPLEEKRRSRVTVHLAGHEFGSESPFMRILVQGVPVTGVLAVHADPRRGERQTVVVELDAGPFGPEIIEVECLHAALPDEGVKRLLWVQGVDVNGRSYDLRDSIFTPAEECVPLEGDPSLFWWSSQSWVTHDNPGPGN